MRPVGARVLRFDSGFAAEGCGIAFGHACGVRVQRVHKVQRGVVSPLRGDGIYAVEVLHRTSKSAEVGP